MTVEVRKSVMNKSKHIRQNANPNLFSLCEGKILTDSKIDCYEATKTAFQQMKRWREKVETEAPDKNINTDNKIVWPDKKRFAACLTHDVDNVSKYHCFAHARRLRSQVRSYFEGYERRALAGIKSSILSICDSMVHQGRLDPLFCYERWLEIERSKDVRSTFLFLPHAYERSHYSDGGYRYDDEIIFDQQRCSVREMIKEVHDRGWEVGLHASWYSYNEPSTFGKQKDELERVIDNQVVSSRQHNLHFDIRYTPNVLAQCGIKIDSSIGFNDSCGFRYGSSVPWQLQSTQSVSNSVVWELPLCIQDKAIMKIAAQHSRNYAISVAQELIQQAKNEGGVVCLLWHPRTIQWPEYIEMYLDLIDALRSDGAWFGTMGEIWDLCN